MPRQAAIKPPDFDEREARCRELGLHVKHRPQLVRIRTRMQAKIIRLWAMVREQGGTLEDSATLRAAIQKFVPPAQQNECVEALRDLLPEDIREARRKRARLVADQAVVEDEILFRDEKWVVRSPIGTVYYIDLTSGNDANTGLSTAQAWLTLQQYTTTTVRSAGDIAYVSAGTTQVLAATVVCDEDGAENNPIQIIGCDATVNDPWGDASDVRPIIDCSGGAYYLIVVGDYNWRFARLHFKDSASYMISANGALNLILEDCYLVNSPHGTALLVLSNTYGAKVINCDFDKVAGTSGDAVTASGTAALFDGCTFQPTTSGDGRGIVVQSGYVYVRDCQFGNIVAYGTNWAIQAYTGAAYCRNVTINGTYDVSADFHFCEQTQEDWQGVNGDNYRMQNSGRIDNDATVRTGGASSSAKMQPSEDCGVYWPLRLGHVIDGAFRIWCPAETQTITVYIKGYSWSSFPTAAELFLEARYLSDAAAGRTTVQSTEVLVDNTTWTAFTVSFTPSQEGWAILDVYLGKYVSGDGVYVDIRPVQG